MMKVGLVGLPNAGKTSFFNLLAQTNAKVDLYPFTTIEKNVAIVSVPDERLETIKELIKPERITYASLEVVDIAGLVKGAHEGEGLGNKFLSHVREVDLMLHIIRNFEESSVPHIYETIDPVRDAEIVETELAMADLEVIKRTREKLFKQIRTPEVSQRLELFTLLEKNLSEGKYSIELSLNERELLKDCNLFVLKPMVYILNCSNKNPLNSDCVRKFSHHSIFLMSVALENDLNGFSEEEKREIRKSFNLDPQGPLGVVEECFRRLNLIRFYTIKGQESRAWSVPRGTNIVEAVKKIHSDMAAGFIKAEVLKFEDLKVAGSFNKAKELGLVRIEGRNYSVQDGDIILVKFIAH
jgi:GTP-binding protein YchF